MKCPVCKMTADVPRNIVSGTDYLRNHLLEWHPTSLTENGPFTIYRINNYTYCIDLNDKSYHIYIKNGSKNSLLSLLIEYNGDPTIIEDVDSLWPHSIIKITSRKGFHLEQMDNKLYLLNMWDNTLKFQITQGNKNSFIEIDKIYDNVLESKIVSV